MNIQSNNMFGKERLYSRNFPNHEERVIRWEVLDINSNQRIRVRFLSTNSENRQGIRIAIDMGEGMLSTNGVSARAFELWEDECPREFDVECNSSSGHISIYNIFQRNEQGVMRRCSQMAYSGMILDQIGNVYRYRCNDTGANTDFDKLVFEIELL